MLEVVEVGGLATLQDAGRFGWRRFGVPLAGPMDRFAFEAANLLAGNSHGEAVLEIGAGDILLRAQYDCLLAVTGAGFELSINVWTFPLWGSYFVRGGWWVRLMRSGFGMWAYLATAGGFDVPPVLGSRSTYLRGRFGGIGGRPLQPGDVLRRASNPRTMLETAGRTLAVDAIPPYGAAPTVDVLLGPQADRFTAGELSTFFAGTYSLSEASDRMGYRLEGPPLRTSGSSDLTSEGMAVGSVQVPSDGQPIVMMADCATTGGYPKIACVTSAALPLLAQCTPGRDQARFHQVSIETAQANFRSMMNRLKTGIIEPED